MAEEFLHGGICGGTSWWNLPPSRSVFAGCSSPCTPAAVPDFGWSTTDLQWNQSFPPSNNSSCSTGQLDSPEVAVLKPMNQDFPFDDQQPSAVTTTTAGTSCSALCSYPPATTSTSAAALIQTLFDDDPRPPPPPPVFSGRPINYSGESYGGNDQLSSSFAWNKLPPFFRPASFLKQQQQLPVQFGNEAAFWNAASNDGACDRFSASSPSEFLRTVFANKPTCPNNQTLPTKRDGEDQAREGNNNNNKKGSGNESQAVVKRARIETPSPLPTFKVRKEKLGDRITALQQLVSPFGKTDTASVLHEAIEYIKLLHEQVSVLSSPYMKQGSSPNPHQQMMKGGSDDNTNQELRSRGLCLVPISSTFPVATETTVDFWTPTFGATFR